MTEAKDVKAEVLEPAQAKETSKALTVSTNTGAVARPVVTPAEAKEIIAEWTALKTSVLRECDIRREVRTAKDGKETEIAYIKKSGWRNMATFFGLRVEVVLETEKMQVIGTTKLASVTYRATAPNGRSCDGDGHCGSDEGGKGYWPLANLVSTAHTRAYNRAVSNLVGGGEVSGEEVEAAEQAEKAKPQYDAMLAKDLTAMLTMASTLDELRGVWADVEKANQVHLLAPADLATLLVKKDELKAKLAGGAK